MPLGGHNVALTTDRFDYTSFLFPTGMFMFSIGLSAQLWAFHSQLRISTHAKLLVACQLDGVPRLWPRLIIFQADLTEGHLTP